MFDISTRGCARLIAGLLPELVPDDTIDLFLIGKAAKDSGSVRARLRAALTDWSRVRVHLPEEMFSEVMALEEMNLLQFETLLAKSVHVIVMCLESPGALAELGAFAANKDLRARIIVVNDKKFEHQKNSFLYLGPIRYIQQAARQADGMSRTSHDNDAFYIPFASAIAEQLSALEGAAKALKSLKRPEAAAPLQAVISLVRSDLSCLQAPSLSEDFLKAIKKRILQVANGTTVTTGLENLVAAQTAVLVTVAVLEEATQGQVEEMLNEMDPAGKHGVLAKASLEGLRQQLSAVTRNNSGAYILTNAGYDRIRRYARTADARSHLDSLRSAVLISKYRGRHSFGESVTMP